MIAKLEPQAFDDKIQEIHTRQVAQELARLAKNEYTPEPTPPDPIVEIPAPIKKSHTELLKRAVRNRSRHDSKIVWSLLHRDVYESLLHILDCNDLGVVSEACYIIYDSMPKVDWRAMYASQECVDYFYEIAHGDYLGLESWARLVQSYITYDKPGEWVGVPIVQNNRYKTIKPFNIHTRATAYMLYVKGDERT